MTAFKINLIIVSLFCSTCLNAQQKADVKRLDLTQMVKAKATINTTDIFELVDFVPLETKTECLTSTGRTVITKDEIYLFSKEQKGILKFDRQGHFICKLGNLGRGPGEFCVPLPLDIQCSNNLVYVFDKGCLKVVEYDTNGNGARDISLENGPHIDQGDILNDTCFLIATTFPLYNTSAPYFQLMSFNYSGKLLHRFPLEPGSKEYKISHWPSMFWHFNNQLFFKSTYSDFIYKVTSPNKREAVYELSPGKKRNIPDGALTFSAAPGKIEVVAISEINDYLVLSYFYGEEFRDAVYNKNTGDFSQVQTNNYTFKDKIETCTFLWPNNLLPNHSNVPGEFVSFLQPVDLKSVDISKLSIHSSIIRSKLLALQRSINIEDNPVLVIMKEKVLRNE